MLAYWYLVVVVAGIIAFLLIWVWLLRGGLSDTTAYWRCMDRQTAVSKGLGWDEPGDVFSAADAACAPRPNGLTDQEAFAAFTRRWTTVSSSPLQAPPT
jgi:hypothetical protein